MSEARRTLVFNRLDEVMPEVDRLLADHRIIGNWSLAQICNHLAGFIIRSVDGSEVAAPWLIRKTLGPIIKNRILKTGRFPDGARIPKSWEPKPGLDARAEAEAYRAAIQAFGMHMGAFKPHPLMGPLSRDEWSRLHMLHAAHHLAFVIPGQVAVD